MSNRIKSTLQKNTVKIFNENSVVIPTIIKIGIFLNLFVTVYAYRGAIDLYWGYFAYLILMPVFIYRYKIPKNIGLLFGFFFIVGIIKSIGGQNNFLTHFKVMAGLSASYLFFYYIVVKLNLKVTTLFRFYCKVALIMAFIAIIQMVSHLLGHPLGIDLVTFFGNSYYFYGGTLGVRIAVFFGEPSYFAMFMSGAVFVAVHDFIFQQKKFYFKRLTSIILLIGVYFSFSGTIPLTLGISFFLIIYNYGFIRYGILVIPIALFGISNVLTSSKDFESRYDGTFNIFIDRPDVTINVHDYHGSSVVLYNNFHVAIENFKRNPLFGTGIGSHPIAFEKYSLTKNVSLTGFNNNQKDANSMFNRLLSETGLFGLLLFGWIIFGHFVKRNEGENHLWLISNACLVIILINLGRQGHYFLAGFPFYIWLYYCVWKENNKIYEK